MHHNVPSAFRLRAALGICVLLTVAASSPMRPDLLAGLRWRNIGPFRGGRVSAVSGAIGEPGTFYMGLPAAGVWKTTSAGHTWYPVFDAITEVSSIGALEVAPSNANVVYAGTGDLITGGSINEGNGVWKTTDAGKTWKHMGLDATKQIPSIVVDPRNADVVLVAAQGDIHAKGDARGVYRSTDGGSTWTKTLAVGDTNGVQKVAIAYDRPDVVFATTVRHYTSPPPPSGVNAPGGGFGGGGQNAPTGPTGLGLHKSADGGITWKELAGGGLPRIAGRTSIAVAMNTNAQRVFLITNAGLYRSDDGGARWKQMAADDERIRNGQGGYNCGVFVDPKNPDVVYTFATSAYKSVDGGNTFTGFRGAPGGDDPQQGWIDPTNGSRMLFGYDQGAIVTFDGGESWSTWYNQSTEQVYHISADNSYPYWVYATQQDAGAVRARQRGNDGEITPFDWGSVNGWEWGTIVADPRDPNTVYSSGSGIVKISYPSGQWISVSPQANTAMRLRTTSSQPLVWAPWNQHELLAGFQYVMATTDGGAHWKRISPDLGYGAGVLPPADTATPLPGAPQGGAIESMSASTIARGTIWVGTSNGLVKVTKDEGKTWDDVSIPGLPYPAQASIASIDASHTDAGGAYVAVDAHRPGDYMPRLYRTHDYGRTWMPIINGLPVGQPSGSFARVVRADPRRAGLLVAGTESGMFVSFDDGDDWQSLQLNLPNTSYRDLVFKGNDLVVGTYGRGIYILDDYAVLRQMTPAVAGEAVHLFKPDVTIRTRRNVNADTPLPSEVPHALNPPDGMIIHYSIAAKPAGEITLDVLDASGTAVRHLSSAMTAPVAEAARPPHPNSWLAPPQSLTTSIGTNRVNWDLRYDAPPAFTHSYEINANPGLTPASPEGALAPPGTYTIRLTIDGKTFTQTALVENDPRSPASAADVRAQAALLSRIQANIRTAWDGYAQIVSMRTALNSSAGKDSSAVVNAFRMRLDTLGGSPGGGRGGRGGGGRMPAPSFYSVHARSIGQLTAQDNGDLAPNEPMLQGYGASCRDLASVVSAWAMLNAKELPVLNAALVKGGHSPLSRADGVSSPKC